MSTVDLSALNTFPYKQLSVRFDEIRGALHVIMQPPTRPCFNVELLQELYTLQKNLEITRGGLVFDGRVQKVKFLVFRSGYQGVYSLGGDLSRIRVAIKRQDREWLAQYAKLCIDNLWLAFSPSMPVTTISLVQGTALGSGFESALATDVLIAEDNSRFGFPESIFNLFPGMGAISFLSRRIGLEAAKDIVSHGEIYDSSSMDMLGVVDGVAEAGNGLDAVNAWIDKHSEKLSSYQAIQRAKKIVSKLDHKELSDVAEIWVNAAMNINDRNLRVMETLVRAQLDKPLKRLKIVP